MRPALIPPEVTLALSPARLRALLERLGAGLSAKSSPLEAARALFTGDAADALCEAFATIARFTHPDGPAALLEAARVVGFPIDPRAVDEGAADLAASIVLAKDSAPVLRRARIRLDRLLAPRPSYELAPSREARPPAARIDVEAIARAALGEAYRAAFAISDDAGRLHAAILYAAPAVADSVANSGKLGRVARVVHRPLRADLVRVEDGRFLLTTARPQHLIPLAEAFGAALHGDSRFWSLRPSFSFKSLIELGAAGFAKLKPPPGIASWSIVGLQWDSGDGARHESRGPNAFASLEKHAHVDGGYFPRATLRIFPRGAAHAVDVYMQLPYRIGVSDARHEALARAAVAKLGGFAVGVLPDDARTLAPWVHPEWRWREVLGDAAVDALVATELLLKTRGFAHRALARSVKVNAVPGEDASYATPEDFSLAAWDVGEDEQRMLKLDVAAFAAHVRRAMGLSEVPKEESVAGVVEGILQVTAGKVRVVYAMKKPKAGLVRAIRKACRVGVTPVLLVPAGRRLADEGILQIELDLAEQFGAASFGRVVGRIASALGFEKELEPWRMADSDQALVLERATQHVWLCGVLLKLTDNVYRLLEKLALAPGRIVPTKELGAYVSKEAAYSDVVVRRTRERLPGQVTASFEAAGQRVPEGVLARLVVLEGKGGYRLGVGVKVC